ncbi:hypothetical protein V6N13_002018 [Hibiscus sabdariffa]|uniref:Uncharacterized protein n=1 Tax=Hibiscus sabdariffa TaxID=183260 RepID=A0ABR2C1K3_9ROSI
MYCDHALLLQIFGADCCPEIKLMSLRPNPLKIGSCGSEGDESFVNSEDLLLRCFRLAKNFASSSELRNVVNGTISRSRVSHGVTCERPEMDWYNANTPTRLLYRSFACRWMQTAVHAPSFTLQTRPRCIKIPFSF